MENVEAEIHVGLVTSSRETGVKEEMMGEEV